MKAQQKEENADDDARHAAAAAHGSAKTLSEPVVGQPMKPTAQADAGSNDADLNAPSPPPTTP
eukprot:941397-Pleurochrysis_carterae.AAC.1